MEEIALVFSSLAGACTAVALDKIPRRKYKQTVTVSSAVENQLHSLRIEKEILTKTITRLHNDSSGVSQVQRDKLLIRYQHQLGTIVAKIEKLEIASRYPDLGPVGDSLVTLMDSKLSKLDQRLHEISSKISVSNIQPAQVVQQTAKHVEQAKQEPPRQIVEEKPPVRAEPKIVPQKIEVLQEKIPEITIPPLEVYLPEKRVSVELSTLTTIPNKMPEFPAEFIKAPTVEIPKIEISKAEPKVEIPQLIVPLEPAPLVPVEDVPVIETPKVEPVVEKKVQMPTPMRIPDEEKIEDDDKDLDKIKSEIMKALSKLEQVEVE
ncbi:MAG TPA: hypothetical protein VJR22_03835 [Candidatus Nitrosotalea sp.]|nr:hypothetical protein [Candidatus Nitrosotalea sp.]